ncbi:MAG: HD domain-containing protein [Candidatus Nealsonbacteria bacterium]|nr:HD domain-containing protein [Candidatus Nealsonbacteria bacterium]
MATDEQNASVELAPDSVLPVAVSSLRASQLNFDLYVRPEICEPPKLYREKSFPLEAADLKRLRERGVETLFVANSDYAAYRTHVLDGLADDSSLEPTERYNIVREVYREAFDTAFQGESLDPMLQFTGEFSKDLADTICENDIVMSDLHSLMEHDSGTYTHCANVSTYSLALAKAMGLADLAQLQAVATGAILHDIGKRAVQLSTLNKPGRLSPEQRAEIERHPLIGFRDLVLREEASWAPLMMVYQHHERIDGKGYPVGVPGKEIHDWAKICSVADVFHALTSERPYRTPMLAEEALQFLEKQADAMFDPETVRCWTMTLRN